MPARLPEAESEIDEFIAAFEDGSLPKERWTHGAHLLTGACYVHALGESAATARMRERVCAFNLAVGGKNTASSGYHETITVFWIKLLARHRREYDSVARAQFAHDMVTLFEPQRGLLAEYYSFNVVESQEARCMWIAPDLREMER